MSQTILLVDDSISIVEKLAAVLQDKNYNVITASNGAEALEYTQDGNPHKIKLIITDLVMPIMDGLQLIKTIRSKEDFEDVPIIVLTSKGRNRVKMQAKTAGATGFITKPFVPSRLVTVVQNLLKN